MLYPLISSSLESLPSLFKSSASNVFWSSRISSCVIICVVKNVRAACCSLFVELNSFKFLRASEFTASSSTNASVLFMIHWWFRAYAAVILFSQSNYSIFLTRSMPSGVILDQMGPLILYTPFWTLFRISSSESPSNGGFPHKRIYKMTPHDQTSHCWL